MKFYDYSVKQLLQGYFGEDTIFSMRKPHESVHKSEDDERNLLQLKWQYADEHALGLFLEANYLLDTFIQDDYIAYTFLFGEKKMAYLMFMVTEDDPLFQMDVTYSKDLIEEWRAKGYEAKILRVCIDVIYYGPGKTNGFHFGTHSIPGGGAGLYEVKTINNQDILVFTSHSCWMYYYKKIIAFSERLTSDEYDCLFEIDAEITTGEDKKKETIGKGYEDIRKFFIHSAPVRVVYQEFKNTKTYSCHIIAGEKLLNLSVNRCNLICELNIAEIKPTDSIIIDSSDNSFGSLISAIPDINSIRILDPVQMHAYALQMEFSDGSIRNYYLKCFDTRHIPVACEIDDYRFTEDILRSVSVDHGNAVFSNGYIIPKQFLYYHGYRQVHIEQLKRIICDKAGVRIESLYRLPLKEFKSHFSICQYWGNQDECFGPKLAWLDGDGNRVSDIALFSIDKNDLDSKVDASKVCVEPHGRYGYLRADGSWLAPPIYDKTDDFTEGCAKVIRSENGTETTFILTADGEESPFNFPFDVGNFTNDRCAFNAEKWQGEWPSAGYYWQHDYDEVKPGKWGFMDSKGNIIVEPKYVFAVGFWNGGGDHSVVARYVDGKLLWGVIDLNGTEVIPCIYPGAYCRWGEAVAFQREDYGPYGLMDFDGNVLLEPMFDYIEAYDPKHRLVTAGDNEDALGVYSLELGKMIIASEYDNIDYDDHIISCEVAWTCKERYFDYDGKELLFPEYDSVYESDGILKVWKNGKSGAIDWDGKIIVPPVLENGMDYHFQYYKKGLLVTGERKLQGLSKVDGTIILPTKFSSVSMHEKLVIASKRTDSNWCICDSLFTAEGVCLLEGPYRHISIDEKNGILTFETPIGLQFCKITYA